MSKRIPFDSKSHKTARNTARRAKVSARIDWTKRDDEAPRAKKGVR